MSVAMLAQRNGHLPVGPGPSDPGWGQSQRWRMEGADPSISLYDADQGAGKLQGVLRRLFSGVLTIGQELPPSEPTMTRRARFSAQQSSLPAARFFQSYTGAGTGRATSPADQGGIATVPRQLTGASRQTSAWGSAELHPATTYDPFPSPASLYPKVV
jgi:hypothetical protein